MVLNFGSYESIFPETDETGEGLGADKKQTTLLDANTYYTAVKSSELNSACNILELQAAAAVTPTALANMEVELFSDSTGYLNKVDTTNTTAVFSTNKYTNDIAGENYIIIEATSLSAPWNSNNCKTIQIGTGKWLVYCTTGTDAVRRAQIHKSLWYGTDGSNSLIEDFTSVTAVKTSTAADVGKRAYYVAMYEDERGTNSYTGTFADTTNNTNMNSWSYVSYDGAGPPKISDETGTDRSGDDKSNPATCRLYAYVSSVISYAWWDVPSGSGLNRLEGGSDNDITVRAYILCKGACNFSLSGEPTSSSLKDFYTDNSIPLMTATTSTDFQTLIVQSIAIAVPNGIKNFQVFAYKKTLTGTGTITCDVSLNNGVHYQTNVLLDTVIMNSLTSDYLILKLNLNAGASAGTASCSGFGVRYWDDE